MKIEVVKKTNLKLLEYFPIDPYADFIITTKTMTFQLQIAFLSIQSEFFEDLYNKNIKSISLSHLEQFHLQRILKALYGDQLIIDSFEDLKQIYSIIGELRINEYKIAIIQQISKNLAVWNPIQLLEFCMNNNILKQQIKTLYFINHLEILQDQKYYLELSKISSNVMKQILECYLGTIQNQDQTQKQQYLIHSILQNYFNRKKILPWTFFQHNDCIVLSNIWQKFHPDFLFERQKFLEAQKENQQKNKNDQQIQYERKIKQLENIINEQNQLIQKLQAQNNFYKTTYEVKSHPKLILFHSDEEDHNDCNSQIIVDRQNNQDKQICAKQNNFLIEQKKKEETKQNVIQNNFELNEISTKTPNQFDGDQLSYIQTPMPRKKLFIPTKQPKRMNQMKSNKSKKIFI